ncbi:MAG: NAD-dependent epimerase/dehydratase family protein [Rubrivivax sp.]
MIDYRTKNPNAAAASRRPTRHLVIGSNGQVGTELSRALVARDGPEAVITADLKPEGLQPGVLHEALDVTDAPAVQDLLRRHRITQVWHLAAALSVRGEQDPAWAWRLNMEGLLNVLEAARQLHVDRVFWPSSIAVFGPSTPPDPAPQNAVMDPVTVYGVSKVAGEGWCRWFRARHGLDVRSLRYPGLLSWRTPPGGGTTDYAVEVFHAALRGEVFRCPLHPDETLPMMAMDDAVRATLELMAAPAERLCESGAYNVAGLSFSPRELVQAIHQHGVLLKVEYVPDVRQAIASSWPARLDDRAARADWGWQPRHDLAALVDTMLSRLSATSRVR